MVGHYGKQFSPARCGARESLTAMLDRNAMPGRQRPCASNARQPSATRPEDRPALARRVLQVLSILCEPVPASVVGDCLAQSDSAVTESVLQAALETLVRQGHAEATADGFRCVPAIREKVTRQAAAEGTFEPLARAVKRVLPVALAWNRTASFRTYDQGLREIRIAFYRQDSRAVQQALWEVSRQFPPDGRTEPPLVAICAHPFDRDWFLALSAPIRAAAAGEMLAWSALRLEPCPELLQCLEHDMVRVPAAVRVFQADLHILQGRFQTAAEVLAEVDGPALSVRLAWMSFLRGQNEEAMAQFESGLHDLRREQSKADAFYRSYGGCSTRPC